MTWLSSAAIALACIAVGLIHRQLSRSAARWPGAVVPALWVAAALYLVAAGAINSLLDVGGLVLVTVVLARTWDDGRRQRAALRTPASARART